MNATEAAIERARGVALRVLDGALAPADGCIEIAALCEANYWPAELTPFATLAHEQDGHEGFGFNRENSAPLVVEECRVLLGGRV